MKLEPFEMERMQSQWENRVACNLSESGVHPLSLQELIEPEDLERLLKQRLAYTQSNGTEELRSSVAALYPGAGIDNVVVTNGSAEANFICAWRLLEPGDEVVMILPNYMQLFGVVRCLGATVVPVALREEDGWAPDIEGLRKAVTQRTRLLVVCNPNNPTGAVFSVDEMHEIVGAAARHGAWILADEVYRGAERDGVETPSFWGTYERLVVTSGLSKAYGLPGLRIGWALGPPATIFELWARKDYLTISPGALSDLLARRALDSKVRRRLLERTRRILRANYPVLCEWVGRRAAHLRIVPPRAGAIAYLRYSWKVNSTALVTRLRDEQSVLVVPGDHFGMDGYLRVGFGSEPEHLRSGLARIKRILDSLV